jgi:RNA polymerase sigma-70 factor (ECF subfamily)
MRVMTGEATIAVPEQRASRVSDRLAELFDAHHERLYRLARRMSRDPDTARDLVQETFLRAARRPGSIPSGVPREEAWLVRVLVNLCRDRWRQTRTRERLTVEGAGTAISAAPNPESALIARAVVWHALNDLPPRRRAVLIMNELEGVSIQTIARTLGVTQTTVRWHLSVGRREMARAIRRAETTT